MVVAEGEKAADTAGARIVSRCRTMDQSRAVVFEPPVQPQKAKPRRRTAGFHIGSLLTINQEGSLTSMEVRRICKTFGHLAKELGGDFECADWAIG